MSPAAEPLSPLQAHFVAQPDVRCEIGLALPLQFGCNTLWGVERADVVLGTEYWVLSTGYCVLSNA
jgi:hypothetical protein